MYASLDLSVRESLTVAEGHSIGEEVRHALFHSVEKLDDITVHVDPDAAHEAHDATRHHVHGGG